MAIINTLILPLLITLLPLILIWTLNKITFVKSSFRFTLLTMVVSMAIGFFTPFYAMTICAEGLVQSMPDDQSKCLTGAVIFLPIGILITMIAFAIGCYYCVKTYRKGMALSKNLISKSCFYTNLNKLILTSLTAIFVFLRISFVNIIRL